MRRKSISGTKRSIDSVSEGKLEEKLRDEERRAVMSDERTPTCVKTVDNSFRQEPLTRSRLLSPWPVPYLVICDITHLYIYIYIRIDYKFCCCLPRVYYNKANTVDTIVDSEIEDSI